MRARLVLCLRVRSPERLRRGRRGRRAAPRARSEPARPEVSDKPWEAVEPYLLDGLDVFVGAESLVARGLAAGAAGAVSGLAGVYPEVVAALVREPTPEHSDEAERLRSELDRFPFQAAAKAVGAPRRPDRPRRARAVANARRRRARRLALP